MHAVRTSSSSGGATSVVVAVRPEAQAVHKELEADAGRGLDERAVVDLAELFVHLLELAGEELGQLARDAARGQTLDLGVRSESGFDQGRGAACGGLIAPGERFEGLGLLQTLVIPFRRAGCKLTIRRCDLAPTGFSGSRSSTSRRF